MMECDRSISYSEKAIKVIVKALRDSSIAKEWIAFSKIGLRLFKVNNDDLKVGGQSED